MSLNGTFENGKFCVIFTHIYTYTHGPESLPAAFKREETINKEIYI